MKLKLDTMTPAHDNWDEFCDRLSGPDGCDFRETTPGNPNTATWKCKGGEDKTFARHILAEMGFTEAAIDRSCEYFESHGGYCDCEILFNVQ